ncbi:MAG: hypothetical protein JKX74_09135 [Flavobacteriales bacterium]|nr:hypothetical protein [Flavobacteriales bacterium]
MSAILTISAVIAFTVNGQTQDTEDNDHHDHRNEISLATGIVPLVAEDELTAGFHFHYIRGIGSTNRFGIGIALETIIDEHKHYTASVVFQYRIYKGLILGYAPGLLMRKEDSENIFQLAHHIETAYEFELGEFHIGPMAELGVEVIGVHYMFGIHVGMDF